MPKISVLLPVYNAERYLGEAIESILNQTFKDFEFIIIDDGSTDNSAKIIESFKDPRIVFLQNEANLGVIKTLNKGLSVVRGEFIARMDADDISTNSRLEMQIQFLETQKNYVLVGTASNIIDERSNISSTYIPFIDDDTLRAALTINNNFTHGSIMMRTAATIQVGGYSEKAYLVEDYDLWIKLSGIGKIFNLPQILYQWRENPLGECSRNATKQKIAASKIANGYWNGFAKKSPNLLKNWRENEWKEFITKDLFSMMTWKMANLHLELSKKYFKRKRILTAIIQFSLAFNLFVTNYLSKKYSSVSHMIIKR